MDAETQNETIRSGLIAIWREVLEVPETEDGADFFELGGESVSAIHLAARIENDLGIDCTIEDVFDNPTLGELTEFLAQRS